MADLTPFTMLQAFSMAEIMCSMGMGPDGVHDSEGVNYTHLQAATTDDFIIEVVKLAGEAKNVVIEWRQMPLIGDDQQVHGWLTIREQHPQAPIAMKNQQR